MLCSEQAGAFYNRLQYPITFQFQKQRDFMAEFLLEQGVDSVKYLDGVVETAVQGFGYQGDCPNSEHISKQVLVIPNQHGLREKDIKRISDAVNGGWAALSANEFSTEAIATCNLRARPIPISK
jgi:perosamine synthetase